MLEFVDSLRRRGSRALPELPHVPRRATAGPLPSPSPRSPRR
jgi:hypothetical protein